MIIKYYVVVIDLMHYYCSTPFRERSTLLYETFVKLNKNLPPAALSHRTCEYVVCLKSKLTIFLVLHKY